MKKVLWSVVIGLMALSLLMASCGPATVPATPTTPTAPATPTTPTTPTIPATPVEKPAVKPSAETPKYGGTLNLVAGDQTSFDPPRNIWGESIGRVYERPMEGDWTKGSAGGYGTKETDWAVANNDLFILKQGRIAESMKWTVDSAKDEATVVLQIAKGIHYALDPKSEASRLVNGREVTADDVVYAFKRAISPPNDNFVYRNSPDLRGIPITKTGPSEITIKVPVAALVSAISRFSGAIFIYPPELVTKYGDLQNWKNAVGTGPFILSDYVPSSIFNLVRNPNYYLKDPIGPGKGNQLPYLDAVRILIIPDVSTKYAALRTGKLDQASIIPVEDAEQIIRTAPNLVKKEEPPREGRGSGATMVHKTPPFSDIRVRQALMLATDFQTINKNLFGGRGQIMSYPYSYSPDYAGLYVGLDDQDMPPEVKELYNYNPDKARQLLKEAGYPTGLKTSILLSGTTDVDYYSIIKDMWSKVGIDLTLDIKDPAVFSSIMLNKTQTALVQTAGAPISIFWNGTSISGVGTSNAGMIDDPVINDTLVKIKLTMTTDERESIKIYKPLWLHIIRQVYCIPKVLGKNYTFWWPWLKNYSGELWVGFSNYNWTTWVWIDQDLKKSMGY